MAKSISDNTKRRGRPVTTGKGTLVGVRILDPQLAAIDAWAESQTPPATRPEALRQLAEIGLSVKRSHGHRSQMQRSRAKEMATATIDRLTDPSAPVEEKISRKRRLLKGPEEFQQTPRTKPFKVHR